MDSSRSVRPGTFRRGGHLPFLSEHLPYARNRHGEDGEIFLGGYIRDYLQRARGGHLIDIGCGAGPWGIEAAQLGIDVLGVDLEPAMIERALLAATEAGVAGRTEWIVGNASALPVEEGLFDCKLSYDDLSV